MVQLPSSESELDIALLFSKRRSILTAYKHHRASFAMETAMKNFRKRNTKLAAPDIFMASPVSSCNCPTMDCSWSDMSDTNDEI